MTEQYLCWTCRKNPAIGVSIGSMGGSCDNHCKQCAAEDREREEKERQAREYFHNKTELRKMGRELLLQDKDWVIGVDEGKPGGDKTVGSVFKKYPTGELVFERFLTDDELKKITES
jgi:hypothetical protein